jgi:hypothetical protein
METQIKQDAPIGTRVLDVRVTKLRDLAARRPSERPETAKAAVPVADFQSSI